jgi:hypothetical protein
MECAEDILDEVLRSTIPSGQGRKVSDKILGLGKSPRHRRPRFGTETTVRPIQDWIPPSIPAARQPMETPEPSHPQKFLVAEGGDRETGTQARRYLPHMTHSRSGMVAGMRRAGSLAVRDGPEDDSRLPSVRHSTTFP